MRNINNPTHLPKGYKRCKKCGASAKLNRERVCYGCVMQEGDEDKINTHPALLRNKN